jgi:integrase
MKAFLLGAFGGLRRREMDALTWDKVNAKRNLLLVEVSEHGRLKTEDSERELPLAPEAMEFLAQCQRLDRATREDFVIRGDHKVGQHSRTYRCKRVFVRLMSWLREQGVNDPKPIHYLRKLAGETLAEQAGIYAASSYLGHSSVKVTQEYYASGRPTVAPDMGRLMGRKIILFPDSEQKQLKPKRRKAG